MSIRKTHRPATVVALVMALFMAAMEMTVVSTAMPTVVGDLGGALQYAWVFTAYMLASTVTVPIAGKLADLYGRKPVILVSMMVFLIGSMASGQARTMDQLIFFRAIQGLGAGGVQPIALTIVGDIFSLEQRAKMQGVFGSVWAIAGLAGPLLGGTIVDHLSWRWVFYVNVPFGVASALILSWSLVEQIEKKPRTLDFAGAFLLALMVVTLLVGTDGVLPFVLLPASATFLAGFLFVESRAAEPMLPLALFAQRTLATVSAISALAGAAMLGLTTFIPLYAQGVLGVSPTEAGAAIAPMAIGWPVASALSGRLIKRLGFRFLVRSGTVLVAMSAFALAYVVHRGATSWELRLLTAGFGIGMGLSNTAIVIAVQSSVGFSQRGVATSSTLFFRNVGGTIGVGVMGVMLARSLVSNAVGSDLVAQILGPDRRKIDSAVLQSISGTLAGGIGMVTLVLAGLAAAAAVVGALFPKVEAK